MIAYFVLSHPLLSSYLNSMKKRLSILFICQCILSISAYGKSFTGSSIPPSQLKVLQINIWQEGTMVEGGFDAIVNEIIHTDADLIFFSEVRNYNGIQFVPRMVDALQKKGKHYYGNSPTKLDVGIISKYKQHDQTEVYPDGQGSGSILRVLIQVNTHIIAAYSAHLNYTNYACYLPRGYDGYTWKKLKAPVCDADSVLTANRRSWRDESIHVFLNEARKDIEKGYRVILGGDFNEPSHLDWQSDTKDQWDHNGLIINWDCSKMLYDAGFKDAYRMIYPNVSTHPGFTFPSNNVNIAIEKLSWAPEADERDRIDFIYYHPTTGFAPSSASIVGPPSSIIRGKRMEENTKDLFITPLAVWPSDHKGVLIEFYF